MAGSDVKVRLCFQATRENLPRVRALVEAALENDPSGSFSREERKEILLGIQEALSNTSRHGGNPAAKLSFQIGNRRFEARLSDQGDAFDPSAVKLPDPEYPPEHGYGLILLRRTMDRIRFERRNGRNLLLLERTARGHPPRNGSSPSGVPADESRTGRG
ncbi:MAG: ATP-binding protein [Planctomycetota bacterium]